MLIPLPLMWWIVSPYSYMFLSAHRYDVHAACLLVQEHCSTLSPYVPSTPQMSLQEFDMATAGDSGHSGAGVKTPLPQTNHQEPVPAQKQRAVNSEVSEGRSSAQHAPYEPQLPKWLPLGPLGYRAYAAAELPGHPASIPSSASQTLLRALDLFLL